MNVIEFDNIWEKYRIKFINEGKIRWEEVWVLEGITLNVEKGQVIGIIGQNGAGKTTLLKLIAGMLVPDRGQVRVEGKVSALMELGAGFNPEFTGRENIILNANIYNINENNINEQINKIIEFAGIGKFIDAPIKYYSQGMYMRLAFALAIFVEPDILLIDDILAVGDEEAQQKCVNKIFELKQVGKTIVLVSHDMNMIGRLCDRAVLLEKGKIIYDGPSSRAIGRYLESVGNKDAIAVLRKDNLRITFNNGRLILSYLDNNITKGMGWYVSYGIEQFDIRYPSFNEKWRINKSTSDEIVAEALSQDNNIFQVWSVMISNNEVKWQVQIKDSSIKQVNAELFLTSDYDQWLTLEKEGVFSPFAHRTNWDDLGFNSCPEATLAIISHSNGAIPALVFKSENKDSDVKLFNSGYAQEARIVQLPIDNSTLSANIKIFHTSDAFKDYIENNKQLFLAIRQQELTHIFLKQEEERQKILLKEKREQEDSLLRQKKEEEKQIAKQKRQQQRLLQEQQRQRERLVAKSTLSSDSLRLFVDTESKCIRLYWKDREITSSLGLHAYFSIGGKDLVFKDAEWRVKKPSAERLILTLGYNFLELSEMWAFTAKDKNTVELKIEIINHNNLPLSANEVKVHLDARYEKWSTPEEQGNFSELQYVNNIAPVRLKNSRVSSVSLNDGVDRDASSFFFEAHDSLNKRILGIYKSKNGDKEFFCINISKIIPKNKRPLRPRRYSCFKGRIILGEHIRFKTKQLPAYAAGLKNSNLEFIFDKGSGVLLWKNRKLTSGLGVYTSVRSAGIWHDSHQAIWRTRHKGAKQIIVEGHWPYIPISQLWYIQFIKKYSIFLKVLMSVYNMAELEIEQTNIMLSREYKNWIAADTRGMFSDEFTRQYDILPFRLWCGRPSEKAIKAEQAGLPDIIFGSNAKNKFLKAVIENTDYIYKARLLQFQKSNRANLSPGEYLYFEGVIKIVDKK